MDALDLSATMIDWQNAFAIASDAVIALDDDDRQIAKMFDPDVRSGQIELWR